MGEAAAWRQQHAVVSANTGAPRVETELAVAEACCGRPYAGANCLACSPNDALDAQYANQQYLYYPPLPDAEGPNPKDPSKTMRGAIQAGYGSSHYEFHYEYPINGIGVRKDLITVIASTGTRIPLFVFCRRHGITVTCRHCGQDITYEVSRCCPARDPRTGSRIR
jgi:hypothetical protein